MFSVQSIYPTLANAIWRSDSGVLRSIVLAIAGTALLAISARIQVNFYPVPMTMQTFAVLVIGMSYGWRLGGATVLLYLAQGAVGLPVFASGAGFAYFAGPTGGYLIGFLAAAVAIGWLGERGWDRHVVTTLAAMAIGTAIIFLLGAAWLTVLIGFEKAITAGVIPFLLGAAFKIGLGAAFMPLSWKLVGRNPSQAR